LSVSPATSPSRNSITCAVVGAAGYAGGELLRLLLQHPQVRTVNAVSRSQAGKLLADVHPGLVGLTEGRFAALSPSEAARAHDVVFLALEHGESSKLMPEILLAGPRLVIDLAADFRVADKELYARYYGAHPTPELLPQFTYALADVLGSRLEGAKALAAPGCFATAALLASYPLAGLAGAAWPALFAVTGSSGAGVHPKPTTHHPARGQNLFAYSPMAHRHEAEVLGQWHQWRAAGQAGTPRLMTHAGPFVRGIHLTLHARLETPTDLAAVYRRAYEGRPFVRVVDAPPQVTHAVGTNFALIQVVQPEARDEVQVNVVIDNLLKGAGGQAVQAMNLSLGLPETTGLMLSRFFPC
jgi:LysW-gamma-L-alpha-aminoadipyl-6-phosphate/LysW-L-glutamyl-5-phosphate reductase